ncbi:MAG: NADH-quinone oxidoreductase subunit NuoE [Candidatus Hydrogenedentes bacterium]|nr:NADH-quinone oxidoreductase subunit NuoE [Candidatus Hydrogenedentota bacterium]
MTDTLQQIDEIEGIVARHGRGPEAVIPILQAIQTRYRYLPDESLKRVCELTEITPADIEGVASFYSQFRRKPVGRHVVSVCDGTACHVNGAEDIHDGLHDTLRLRNGNDTSEDGEFTVQKVACLGCCSLAPALRIDDMTYAHLRSDTVGATLQDFLRHDAAQAGKPRQARRGLSQNGVEIRLGLDSCCVAGGTDKIREILDQTLEEIGATVPVKHVSCVHMCHQVPVVEIVTPDKDPTLYVKVKPEDVRSIVTRHFQPRAPIERLRITAAQWMDRLYNGASQGSKPSLERHEEAVNETHVASFLDLQCHIATEHRGELDPGDLDEYLRKGGFMAVEKCLLGKASGAILMNRHRGNGTSHYQPTEDAWTSQEIIDEILKSGLRGRGGAGFPTGRKWQLVHDAPGGKKYIICNGDEGDPGAFMDRMILESYSYRVLEGMIIAARAVGANEGYLYIRAEYPMATERMRNAIKDCEAAGLLGDNILGTDFSLHLSVMEGAGAFVCGEETALIASLEGRRGTPSIRPPYPAQQGLHGRPTLINNVETFSVLSWIIRKGADAFAAMGTEKSKGTKVFSLAGKIERGGLIEVPMGITIRQIVEDIGGGIRDGRQFKAVLVGGPSGGCIPASMADTPVDYEALAEAGAMMGSGGMVVLDDSDCIVEMARYFLSFTQHESCGKCVPCRIGTKRLLEMLTRLCNGTAKESDIDQLDQLGRVVKNQSLCGLGKTAPNPILTALKYFREEFDAHVQKKCPAGKCKALIDYWIEDNCIGCTLCAQACPVDCIETHPYTLHVIDLEKCTRCDLCLVACPVDAVKAGSR